jgi:hypothetical protein
MPNCILDLRNVSLGDTCLIIWALLCTLVQAGIGANTAFAALFFSWKIAVPATWQIVTPPILSARIPTIALAAALLLLASFATSPRGTINWSRWISKWSGGASIMILGIGIWKHPEVSAIWPFTVLERSPDSASRGAMFLLAFAPALLTSTGFITSTLLGFCLLRVPVLARDPKAAFAPPAYPPLPQHLTWEWITVSLVLLGIFFGGIQLLDSITPPQIKELLAQSLYVISAVGFLAFVISVGKEAIFPIVLLAILVVLGSLIYLVLILMSWLFFILGLSPLVIAFLNWAGFVVAGVTAVGLLIAGAITLSVVGYEPAMFFMRANLDRLTSFPFAHLPALEHNWTETEFISMLQAATVYRQATVLASISREQLGLQSSRDLLATLERCEPFIGHEPALGTYWRRRHELEEATKQEMDSVH